MSDKPLDVYLNDHLAGATMGTDLAGQLRERNDGTPLGEVMATLSAEIEEDRKSLIELMELVGAPRNPVKQATTWIAEKASRVKFGGQSSGEEDLGNFMALETLSLGVLGKLKLWTALAAVADRHEALRSTDLDTLIRRAQAQHDTLESERIAAADRALVAR